MGKISRRLKWIAIGFLKAVQPNIFSKFISFVCNLDYAWSI